MRPELALLRAEIARLLEERVQLGAHLSSLRAFDFADEAAEVARQMDELDGRLQVLRLDLRSAEAHVEERGAA